WNTIQSEIKIKKINRWKMVLTSCAAIVVLALSVSLFLYFYIQKNEDLQEMLASNPDITPVKIVLDNEETIFPQVFDKDTVIAIAGGNLVLNGSQHLIYEKQENETAELVYNTVIVPKREDYHFILSDETEVWLNSDSKLRFPVNFQGEERKVFLEGEAYFNVATDKAKPFRVELEKGVIEVLGTSFNIHSYADRKESTTTLVSGKIKFIRSADDKEWILNPGKQLTLKEEKVNIEEVNVEEVVAWKKGRFVFNNKSLEDIFYQLEKWFKIEAEFTEDCLKSYCITGVVNRHDMLEENLKTFKEITPFDYKIEKNKIVILKNKLNK
ncbi:MAG: DUF4974 domain-containing protein, partial [Odoribacter sp.]|nr:DUF4974 domain-containing protein [Odoribacter sp.]